MRTARAGRGRHAVAAALACAALAASPTALAAQRSVLLGTVIADSLDAPVAGAEVAIAALRRATRAGDDGAFVLRGLPAGVHVVTVRGVGYEPLTVTVRATGADTVAADLALAPRAPTLARVDVRAAAAPRAAERARARENGGAFVDRAALAASDHRPMSDVLRRVPGVGVARVSGARGSFAAVASARGGPGRALLPGAPRWCYYQIYVDGVRVYTPDDGDPPDIDTFRPMDYEGIEIYRGPAQTPPRFGGEGARCGTVVFWSRTR